MMGWVCAGMVLVECVNRPALPLVMGYDGYVVCVLSLHPWELPKHKARSEYSFGCDFQKIISGE